MNLKGNKRYEQLLKFEESVRVNKKKKNHNSIDEETCKTAQLVGCRFQVHQSFEFET